MKYIKSTFLLIIFMLVFCGSTHADGDEISNDELTRIISSVLNHKDVSMFLHPDVPGRLPVTIAIGRPYSYRSVQLAMFGEPVIVTTDPKDLNKAVKLRIKCDDDSCRVKINYDPEGMFGEIEFIHKKEEWIIQNVAIYE